MTERTEKDKQDQEKAFNFSSYNKLHWMLGGEGYALRMARDMFVQDLTRARKAEKDYCRRYNKDARMTDAVYNSICDLATRCESFYEVEALARYVFDDNFIPDVKEIKSRAAALRRIVPVFDTLKRTNNPRRSF